MHVKPEWGFLYKYRWGWLYIHTLWVQMQYSISLLRVMQSTVNSNLNNFRWLKIAQSKEESSILINIDPF